MSAYYEKYGLPWNTGDPLVIEIECVRRKTACLESNREWLSPRGIPCGLTLFEHYRNLIHILWPEISFHKWNNLLLNEFIHNSITGVMGPASSGKTHTAAIYGLAKYFVYPRGTTILCSSTTREMLEFRIWGEIKKYFRKAKDRDPRLPGNFIESKQLILTDSNDIEGREFRDGIKGVACYSGGEYHGLENYVGIKNERVIVLADEAQFMPKGFSDASANLAKIPNTNPPRFQLIAMGNPKDPTDALGDICEPHPDDGGWEGVDQTEKTRKWKTRRSNGVCIQLVGTDSPNMDVPEGSQEPYPYLIGRKHIKADEEYYGRDSMQFQMMNLGMMPKGGVSRRVITRQMCVKFGAMEEPNWNDENKIRKIFGLDPVYGSIGGGDRCVGCEYWFGNEVGGKQIFAFASKPMIIPVNAKLKELPEDQIVNFVMKYCKEKKIPADCVYYDGTGRSSLTSAFARLWSPFVTPIEFGGFPSDRPVSLDKSSKDNKGEPRTCRQEYGKFVTELWFATRSMIEAGQCRGLPEEVMREGTMREWELRPSNKIDVETKDKTKLRVGRSPDLYDCFVVGLEGARRRGFVISKLAHNYDDSVENWMGDAQKKYKKMLRNQELNYAAFN